MPVKFLDAMAQAIYFYEGHQPQDPNHRNNNPGNLRAWEGCRWSVSGEGFVIFPDFVTGYIALKEDLRAKISGHNKHGLGLHSSLFDLIAVYAPSSDGNDVQNYAQFIAWWLGRTYDCVVGELSSFEGILQETGQAVD